jgi:hypothetical protein
MPALVLELVPPAVALEHAIGNPLGLTPDPQAKPTDFFDDPRTGHLGGPDEPLGQVRHPNPPLLCGDAAGEAVRHLPAPLLRRRGCPG